MFKIISTIILLVSSTELWAEVPSEGEAIYKQTVNIHASLPESQAAMKAFIPEFSYSEVKASFKNNLLRFESKPIVDEKEQAGVKMMMNSDTQESVFDTKEMQFTQYGTVMDINYYYVQQLGKDDKLKFNDETEIINGYKCKKVIDDKNDSTIWYKEDENQSIIPSYIFAGIPGVIVKIEGKQMSYDLVSLNGVDIEAGFFDIPKNHKEISYEQFQDLQEESMEEMMSSMGGKVKVFKTGDK